MKIEYKKGLKKTTRKCKSCGNKIDGDYYIVDDIIVRGSIDKIGTSKTTSYCKKKSDKTCKDKCTKKEMVKKKCYEELLEPLTLHICEKCKDDFVEKMEKDLIDGKNFVKLYDYLLEFVFIELKMLPTYLITRITDWRNGSLRNNKSGFRDIKNKTKDGYTYEVIFKSFIDSMDSILYYRRTKNFKDINKEINYICAIVESNLGDAQSYIENKKQIEKVSEAQMNKTKNEENLEELIKRRSTTHKRLSKENEEKQRKEEQRLDKLRNTEIKNNKDDVDFFAELFGGK